MGILDIRPTREYWAMRKRNSMKPEEKIRYKTKPIRMADETWERLKSKKIRSGLSWNLFLVELLKK